MALDRIHLRKLLKLLFLDPNRLRGALRNDIREELAKQAGDNAGGGGDFYAPFWYDAKLHAFGDGDLPGLTNVRIEANPRRQNLYPQLRDGFLLWWNERRRWTNAPFEPGRSLKAQYPFPDLDVVVKVDGLLSVRDGLRAEHAVYPYFSPEPILSDEAARWGLWLLAQSFDDVKAGEISILDVIRGRTFSLDRTPLIGDEEAAFRSRYAAVLQQREALMEEYV